MDRKAAITPWKNVTPGCPRSCMPNPVEGLLQVYEITVEVLLVLEIFLARDSLVEDLFCGVYSCSQACKFFTVDHFRLRLQSVQYDLQRDFAWTADKADCSVVLALLQVAHLGRCDDSLSVGSKLNILPLCDGCLSVGSWFNILPWCDGSLSVGSIVTSPG